MSKEESYTYDFLIRKIFDYTTSADDILGALLLVRDELEYFRHELDKANTVLKGKEEIIELLKEQLENAKR